MSTSVQDANSGNAGDLIKHSVNLQTLSTLLQYKPWSNGLQLHECHAGRGVYEPQNKNRESVEVLLSCRSLLLARREETDLRQLGIGHADIADGKRYAGSACLNAAMLSNPKHDTNFYEKNPEVIKDLDRYVHRLKATALIYTLATAKLPYPESAPASAHTVS